VNRVRLAAVATVSALALGACSVNTGSGQVESENRKVSGFTGVELRGAGDVTIRQAGSESLTIEADKNVLPDLTSTVSDGILQLGTRRGTMMINAGPIRYRIGVKDLSSVAILGSGTITVPKLDTQNIRVDLSGSGTVQLAGTTDGQQLTISGSGRYEGRDLESRTATVDISGSGSARVSASTSLRVRISGSGSVFYRGNPSISEHISGSGDLIKQP
jgi:hypothetical protein